MVPLQDILCTLTQLPVIRDPWLKLHTSAEFNCELFITSEYIMNFLNGCAYLKEAEFVWRIWWAYDDGLNISDIHIPTCNSNSFSVAYMSVRVLFSEGCLISVGIVTEVVALLDAAQLLSGIVSLATPPANRATFKPWLFL